MAKLARYQQETADCVCQRSTDKCGQDPEGRSPSELHLPSIPPPAPESPARRQLRLIPIKCHYTDPFHSSTHFSSSSFVAMRCREPAREEADF